MAMSLNRAQLIGNLTRDPELKQIPGGQVVASFGVATNFSWTASNGERQTKTDFHNIVVWGKLAEICGQYMKRGMKVFVEGRIQTREWEGEDGVKRQRTEINADNVIMLDGKREGGMGEYAERKAGGLDKSFDSESVGVNKNTAQASNDAEDVSIDDLPF